MSDSSRSSDCSSEHCSDLDDDGDRKCRVHKLIISGSRTYWAFTCIYCILDGKEFGDEWDSWAEIAQRISGVVQMGFDDAMRGLHYVSSPARLRMHKKSNYNNQAFRNVYYMGVRMADTVVSDSHKRKIAKKPSIFNFMIEENIDRIYNKNSSIAAATTTSTAVSATTSTNNSSTAT